MGFPFGLGAGQLVPDQDAIIVRQSRPSDRGAIQEFVRGLAPESRRRRYFSPIRELSEAALDALTNPIPRRELVLVALAGAWTRPRVVALAQYASAKTSEECEIAVAVADDMQGRGLGARMMSMLLDAASLAGYLRAVGDVLPENGAMIALARRLGFRISINPEDADLLRVELPLEERSPAASPNGLVTHLPRNVPSLPSAIPA
jgi:acetyltransferase